MAAPLILEPGKVRLSDWRAIAAGRPARLHPRTAGTIAASADTVQSIVARGAPVYGINTGFGRLASVRIEAEDLETLQRNLVVSHAAGVGPATLAPIVRLMIALKLASLGHGASGVRPQTVALLESLLERDVLPYVPEQGSAGASGDLAPLAHLAATLIGVGEAWYRGERLPAAVALERAGLSPIVLGPKEGLALLNGTQFSTAQALYGLFAIETVFAAALVTGALSTDAAKGSSTPFDARIHALRGHRGQRDVAAALARLLEGSRIRESHLDCGKVQDPYCLRCQPQVMGAALDLLRQAAATLTIEANGVSDNPLVFSDTGEILSGGNFHAEPVAFAADMIAIALAEIGNLSERRISLLVDPVMSSGLPAFLAPNPGINSGFMIAQVTAAALASENKSLAHPASINSLPTSANQEDHVSMATYAARRLGEMARNAAEIVAIELLAAAQGVDLRRPLRTSPRLVEVMDAVRARSAFLAQDRSLAPDVAKLRTLIEDGWFRTRVGLTFPSTAS